MAIEPESSIFQAKAATLTPSLCDKGSGRDLGTTRARGPGKPRQGMGGRKPSERGGVVMRIENQENGKWTKVSTIAFSYRSPQTIGFHDDCENNYPKMLRLSGFVTLTALRCKLWDAKGETSGFRRKVSLGLWISSGISALQCKVCGAKEARGLAGLGWVSLGCRLGIRR